MNDVMPRSDGPENLKILKKSQLGVDFGPCRQTVGLLKLGSDHDDKLGSDHNGEKVGLDHEMCRVWGVVSIE